MFQCNKCLCSRPPSGDGTVDVCASHGFFSVLWQLPDGGNVVALFRVCRCGKTCTCPTRELSSAPSRIFDLGGNVSLSLHTVGRVWGACRGGVSSGNKIAWRKLRRGCHAIQLYYGSLVTLPSWPTHPFDSIWMYDSETMR